MKEGISKLIQQLKDRKIDRRQFFVAGGALGISAADLGFHARTAAAQDATYKFDPDHLSGEIDTVLNTLTQPEFIERIMEYRKREGEERTEFAKTSMTPDALRNAGVQVPTELRLSSRTFEETGFAPFFVDEAEGEIVQKVIEAASQQDANIEAVGKFVGTIPASPGGFDPTVARGGCACGGALSVCGGAGTSDSADDDVRFAATTNDELKDVMRSNYDDILSFMGTPEFRATINDMYALPPSARPEFVNEVFLDPSELTARGIAVPEDLLIQRSSFGDRRPTLFVVKKYLPEEYRFAWENVNVTIDQDVEKDTFTGTDAWRAPLPFDAQATLSGQGIGAAGFEGLRQQFAIQE